MESKYLMSGLPRIIPPMSVVDLNDPWTDDKLDRGKFATILTRVVSNEVEPLVLTVNGKWGSGKTFFLKRWRQDLIKSGVTTLYFNAWQDDTIDDPLVAMIGQLYMELKGCRKLNLDLKNVTQAVSKITSFVGDTITDVAKHITGVDVKGRLKRNCYVFNATVEDYVQQQRNRIELIERLTTLANKVSKGIDDRAKGPIIFIIDELDRCRPDYAIRVLERVKHIMCVSGLVFVLGIDREALSKTIKIVYGDIDTENYLRRFFDLEFVLPKPNLGEFINFQFDQYSVEKILEEMPDTRTYKDNAYSFRQVFTALAERQKLSLREIESACKIFMIVIRGYFSERLMLPSVIAMMILLRICDPEMYLRFSMHKVMPKEFIDRFVGQQKFDDQYAWKEIILGTYFSCGQRLCENKNLQQLEAFCEGKTVFPAAEEIFPRVFLDMSPEQRRLFYEDIVRFKSHPRASYWNGQKAVEQVTTLIDTFDDSTLGQV